MRCSSISGGAGGSSGRAANVVDDDATADGASAVIPSLSLEATLSVGSFSSDLVISSLFNEGEGTSASMAVVVATIAVSPLLSLSILPTNFTNGPSFNNAKHLPSPLVTSTINRWTLPRRYTKCPNALRIFFISTIPPRE